MCVGQSKKKWHQNKKWLDEITLYIVFLLFNCPLLLEKIWIFFVGKYRLSSKISVFDLLGGWVDGCLVERLVYKERSRTFIHKSKKYL